MRADALPDMQGNGEGDAMTTREWLESYRLDIAERLIAHLICVGWPEAPKVCPTCKHQWDYGRITLCGKVSIPYHSVAVVSCEALGNGCLAWEAKEGT